jgi:hypothetical protein
MSGGKYLLSIELFKQTWINAGGYSIAAEAGVISYPSTV